MSVLLDNDVCLKGISYGLVEQLLSTIPGEPPGVLGVAQFVLRNRLRKRDNHAVFIQRLDDFLASAELIEPTVEESMLAAEFESLALAANLPLDTGESQLCAVLVNRNLALLVTGDKRAVVALESLVDSDARLASVCGKIKCMEQLVLEAISQHGHGAIKQHICANPGVDTALSICFGCASGTTDEEDTKSGLNSYINALRAEAPRVLHP